MYIPGMIVRSANCRYQVVNVHRNGRLDLRLVAIINTPKPDIRITDPRLYKRQDPARFLGGLT